MAKFDISSVPENLMRGCEMIVSQTFATFRRTSLFALLVFMAGYPAAAAASSAVTEDLTVIPIESLMNVEVYSASRFTQKASDAPSAVTVLTAADIQTFGWRTLADALRSLPGLHIVYDRNYSYLGARGFSRPDAYNPRFLLLIDGNRSNDPMFDQAMLGTEFPVDIDLIDRIEYVPGPGSAVYGPNAFFGVINVITKRGRDFNGWQFSGELGSNSARKGRVSHGWRDDNGAELLVSATAYYHAGKDQYYPDYASSPSGGWARNLDFDRGQGVFLKGSAGAFSFSLAHAERTKGTPTASWGQVFNAPGSKIMDEQTLASADYRTILSPYAELYGRLFYNQYLYRGDYINDDSPLLKNRDRHRTDWWGGEIKLVSTLIERHKLVAGIEYQKSDPIRQRNYDAEPYSVLLDVTQDSSRTGLYLQDEWHLRNDLLLNLGIRHDSNSNPEDSSTNPRLGLIYKLAPDTTVKALYGRAYRLPNAYELYYDLPGANGFKVNPGLKAERIRSHEMVLEQRLSPISHFRLSVFRNKISNLIGLTRADIWGLDPRIGFANLEEATATGAEATLEQAWRDGTRLRASYSWQRTKAEFNENWLDDAPHRQAKLNLSLPFFDNLWRTGLEAQYMSSRHTLNGKIGGYMIANLTLFSDRLAKNIELSASIYNLFDRHYADPVSSAAFGQEAIPQDGRSLRVKLTFSY